MTIEKAASGYRSGCFPRQKVRADPTTFGYIYLEVIAILRLVPNISISKFYLANFASFLNLHTAGNGPDGLL